VTTIDVRCIFSSVLYWVSSYTYRMEGGYREIRKSRAHFCHAAPLESPDANGFIRGSDSHQDSVQTAGKSCLSSRSYSM